MEYVLNVSYKGFLKNSRILVLLWAPFQRIQHFWIQLVTTVWLSSLSWTISITITMRVDDVGPTCWKWVLQRYYIAKKILDEKNRHRCDFLFTKEFRKTKETLINHVKRFCGKVLWVLRNICCFCSVRIVGGGTQNAHPISRNTPGLGSVNKWRKTKRKTTKTWWSTKKGDHACFETSGTRSKFIGVKWFLIKQNSYNVGQVQLVPLTTP